MTVRELLFPLLLESSNDAAVALAEAYGSEAAFVRAMNERAAELGMDSAGFGDPSGLNVQNRASAKDLQILLMHLYKDRRHILDITRLSQYVSERHGWENNSPARDERGYMGGKHGFTDEAERTFAGVFMEYLGSAERPIGIVLLGSENIGADIEILRAHLRSSVAYTSAF